MTRISLSFATAILCLSVMWAAPVRAESLALASSFRVGSGGVMCTAQNRVVDPRLKSMFDRAYGIICRDAAAAVGQLYALKARESADATVMPELSCDAPQQVSLTGIPSASKRLCRIQPSGLAYIIYSARVKGTLYAAEGLGGYDSALRLGLQSLVLDRPVQGNVEVAVTDASDAEAFARVQAGNLDPDQALAEGYTRNNEGSFAESAEFFENLAARSQGGAAGFNRAAEYLANEALQQSNLGNRTQANRLFDQAVAVADRADPLITRLLRNFRAIHELNNNAPQKAIAQLSAALPPVASGAATYVRLAEGYVDMPLAQRLSIDDAAMIRLGGVSTRLTVAERAALLDAQARYLTGVAMRLLNRRDEARTALSESMAELAAVREGRIESMDWLRAAALTELAAIDEAGSNRALAQKSLGAAIALYGKHYPGTAVLLAAQGRLAGLLARGGDKAGAIAAFRDIVAKGPTTPGSGTVLRGIVRPYFDALTDGGGVKNDAATAADFFAASQALTRPGVAQTQTIFARELSGGSDQAATLFRQSLQLSRDLVRTEAEIAGMRALADQDETARGTLTGLERDKAALSRRQTEVLALLADFPRYRALSNPQLALADLQQKLKPGEAYYKMSLVGDAAYALLVTPSDTETFRIATSSRELESLTNQIRDSISKVEDGQQVTAPFDIVAARALYNALFGPVDARLKQAQHLIFEPDGPLLQLPPNLLVTEQAGVDAYLRRAADPNADLFDFRGVAWLGKDRMVTTAVSAQAFLDVRTIAPSKARQRYLGLGNNAPALGQLTAAGTAIPRNSCDWPLQAWSNPISPAELQLAASIIGKGKSRILTGAAFSDDALRDRTDLADYRIVHFATHGLVTAPRPECPARPALLTSFGGAGSDGLLSFKEIFDLRLDADTIILSACDTAGAATVAASREAGIATGGGFALDGLVRAFVGAGARAVIASHWPVPDDYDATKKLMAGLFERGSHMSAGEAMRESEVKLMDDADTSHPYYWSAFAIIGDASKPLIGE